MRYLILIAALTACSSEITGNGDVQTEERVVDSFRDINVDNAIHADFKVKDDAGGEITLEVEAESNLFDRIQTKVTTNSLTVDIDDNVSTTKTINVSGDCGEIERVAVNNAARVNVEDIDIDVLVVQANNSGDMDLKGEVDEIDVTADNAAKVKAKDLTAFDAEVDLDNAAEVEICAAGTVGGIVRSAAKLIVHCGGDTSGVITEDAGSVESR